MTCLSPQNKLDTKPRLEVRTLTFVVLVTSLHTTKAQKIGLCNSTNETRISREAERAQEKDEALGNQIGFEDKSSLLHNLARMYLETN